MRPRHILIVLGIALAVVLVAGTVLVIGAASSLPSGEHPEVDFRTSEINAARAAHVQRLETQLGDVERRYGTRHIGPRGWRDNCEEGQDNFTREDRNAYVCRIEIVQVMPMTEPFLENASRLGEALLEGDCPDGTDTDRELPSRLGDPLDIHASSGDCTPGYFDPAPTVEAWLPARPTAEEIERASFSLPRSCTLEFRPAHCEEQPLDLRAAVAAAPPSASQLAVVVTGSFEEYHVVPWDCPWPASWFRDSCQS